MKQDERDVMRAEINALMDDVDGLRVTILELVELTKKHEIKFHSVATCLNTVNDMLKMLGDRTYDD